MICHKCCGQVLSSSSEPGKSIPAFCSGLEVPPAVKTDGELASKVLCYVTGLVEPL